MMVIRVRAKAFVKTKLIFILTTILFVIKLHFYG